MRALDIALLCENLTPEALRYGTRCQGTSQFYVLNHVYLRTELATHLPFLQPKLVLILPTPEEWKAESRKLAGYIRLRLY